MQHQKEIAVVMIDLAMPTMDGVVTIRALAKLSSSVRIIAMSGSDKAPVAEATGLLSKPLTANGTRFLSKPFTAETLLKTLWTTLNESQ